MRSESLVSNLSSDTGIVAFGVAVLGLFYMMGKKKREEDRDRKD